MPLCLRARAVLGRGLCGAMLFLLAAKAQAESPLVKSIEVLPPVAATDAGTYWMQARAGFIPRAASAGSQVGIDAPKVVITLQQTERVGTHMYHGLAALWTYDLGKTWTGPGLIAEVDRRVHPNGLLEAPVDMTPQWHQKTGKLLVTGATFWQDTKMRRNVPNGASETAYTVFDPKTNRWSGWKKLQMPDDPKFYFARAGCTQRVDLPNGDILLPIYFYSQAAAEVNYVTVVRCTFDGETLKYEEHGNELTVTREGKQRRTGLYEPSLTSFGGKYLLTLRADEGAFVSTSDDGLHYGEPQPWKFDDGQLLGSYNTQQHWITHSDGLLLGYTRWGANNDKVFRHRAPMFIAQVDPDRLVVERASEQMVLPNLGKAFGNFGVCNVTPEETWIVDCLAGADAGTENVYVAKVRWSRPNRLAAE